MKKLEFMRQRPSLKLSQSELDQYEAEGRPSVVRLKVPHDQIVKIEDAVRGHVEFDTNLMIDPVILRANGTPLYNLATVIEDAQMQITHVIRAEEHLPIHQYKFSFTRHSAMICLSLHTFRLWRHPAEKKN